MQRLAKMGQIEKDSLVTFLFEEINNSLIFYNSLKILSSKILGEIGNMWGYSSLSVTTITPTIQEIGSQKMVLHSSTRLGNFPNFPCYVVEVENDIILNPELSFGNFIIPEGQKDTIRGGG